MITVKLRDGRSWHFRLDNVNVYEDLNNWYKMIKTRNEDISAGKDTSEIEFNSGLVAHILSQDDKGYNNQTAADRFSDIFNSLEENDWELNFKSIKKYLIHGIELFRAQYRKDDEERIVIFGGDEYEHHYVFAPSEHEHNYGNISQIAEDFSYYTSCEVAVDIADILDDAFDEDTLDTFLGI